MTTTQSSSSSSSDASATQSTPTAAKPFQPRRNTVSDHLSPQAAYFISGGIAGATSRTVVSPLERLKIIQQVQPKTGGREYRGVFRSLVRMWREEGFRGFMRGNGINCLRIVPYSAVQFTTYEQLKKLFVKYRQKELDTPTRLASGALAGITSVTVTYPLDLVRSRLSIVSASITTTASKETPSMWGMTTHVVRAEGGIRALYRGLVPTAVGVAPYVGINFASYEALRGVITPPGKTSVPRKLACGALAGSISQTLTYPLDVLRRKMQVTGMGSLGPQYSGAIDAFKSILRTEGITGLYRGLWPNLLKVAPSIATSFFTYETCKELLGAS